MFDLRQLGWLVAIAFAQIAPAAEQKPMLMNLWDGDPPGFMQYAGPETQFPQWPGTVGNVSVPTLAVYLPPRERASGIALIYCSGGSYNKVSSVSDEVGDAEHFVPKGVALIVVKYRTSPPARDFTAALQDARRAVRVVRSRAQEWNIDSEKIGMIGGSAGGHLILTLATHCDRGDPDADDPLDRVSCRPDFLTLLCPWPNKQSVADFPIVKDTPPALICSARDDNVAPIEFAEEVTAAYRRAGASARLWTVNAGGHSAFANMRNAPGAGWIDQFWLRLRESGLQPD